MGAPAAQCPDLQGRAVCVSGGASGIGAEAVAAFRDQGADVGFPDMDEAVGAALADATASAFEPCDLRDINAMQDALLHPRSRVGSATAPVNGAARDDRHDRREVSEDCFDERFAANFRHQFFAIEAFAPDRIRGGGDSVVNTGSASGWMGATGMPVYGAAKAAVHGLARMMAREPGPHRIRVNAVAPGWIMTRRQRRLGVAEESLKAHLARPRLPGPIRSHDVARLVLVFASDASSMRTASNFFVDAGVS